MVSQLESLKFAAFRPTEPLITFDVFRDETYIRDLRRKEIDFMSELKSHGHEIQSAFIGKPIFGTGDKEVNPKPRKSDINNKPAWVVEEGLMKYWDGSCFIEGEDPGLYVLNGADQYWNGEEWSLPASTGFYDLNGEECYWNGTSWE